MTDDCVASFLGDISEGIVYFIAKSGMQYVNLICCIFQCCFYKTSGRDIALAGHLRYPHSFGCAPVAPTDRDGWSGAGDAAVDWHLEH